MSIKLEWTVKGTLKLVGSQYWNHKSTMKHANY
jgi:hypothetical protein